MSDAQNKLEIARKTAATLVKSKDVSQMGAEELKQAVRDEIAAGKADPLSQKMLEALKEGLDREFPVLH